MDFTDVNRNTMSADVTAAHYALQLVAAAGVTLLEPDPQYHYSSTTLVGGAFVGATLPDTRSVRLSIRDLTLHHGDATLDLLGQSMNDAVAWLEKRLGRALRFPDWEMPQGPTSEFDTFHASAEGLKALDGLFRLAAEALAEFGVLRGSPTEVRAWPHHFDIATLLRVGPDPAAPEARTIGLGMSPLFSPAPYFYVAPWPYPAQRSQPALPFGQWHIEGWFGAELVWTPEHDPTKVLPFFNESYKACARILADEKLA